MLALSLKFSRLQLGFILRFCASKFSLDLYLSTHMALQSDFEIRLFHQKLAETSLVHSFGTRESSLKLGCVVAFRMHVCMLSHVQFFATLWTVAHSQFIGIFFFFQARILKSFSSWAKLLDCYLFLQGNLPNPDLFYGNCLKRLAWLFWK